MPKDNFSSGGYYKMQERRFGKTKVRAKEGGLTRGGLFTSGHSATDRFRRQVKQHQRGQEVTESGFPNRADKKLKVRAMRMIEKAGERANARRARSVSGGNDDQPRDELGRWT